MSPPAASASPSDTAVPEAALPAAPCVPPPADATEWFRQEVHVHDGQLKAWLRGQFPSARASIEDIAQESYLRIWKEKAIKPIASAKGFLFTIARHVAVDLLRRERRSPVQSAGDLSVLNALVDGPGVRETISQQEKILLLGRAVASLPDLCREIIILHKLKGLPQAEVAFRLRTTEKAVERHVARGVKRCEDFIRHHGPEYF